MVSSFISQSKPMLMKTVAVDTSGKAGSVALMDKERVIFESIFDLDKTHSETLLSMVDFMLNSAGTAIKDIDLISVTTGPGSFTGIRLGASTVKGLSFAHEIPVVGVSALRAMAANFPCASFRIKPVRDARMGEVYTADFKWSADGMKRLSDDSAVSPEIMVESINEKTIFVGDGIRKYGHLIREKLGDLAVMADQTCSSIRASLVAEIGIKRYKEGKTLDLFSFTPNYLRKSQAEINLEKSLLKKKAGR